ncbi:MAG: hypothetical protein VX034_02375 [Planctomycetota bacterium]|jgi:hypothetical protein|nr:hypothetical protein [Planctomycetota bacterium]MEC8303530.1 hypothetical protein [Planctomycetota bacterium]MEC8345236.1 hypothetical protein [Planctomycetota bacterium]
MSHFTSEMPSTFVKSPRTEAAQPAHVIFGKVKTTCWPFATAATSAPWGTSFWQPKEIANIATAIALIHRFIAGTPMFFEL